VSTAASKPSSLVSQWHLSLPPGDADHVAPLIFAIWRRIEADRPAAAETTTVSPAWACRHGAGRNSGQPGDAIDEEQMRHRFQLRHLVQMLCRHGGVSASGVADTMSPWRDLELSTPPPRDAAAGHHGVGLDRRAIVAPCIPGPVGGVQRDVARRTSTSPSFGSGMPPWQFEVLRPSFPVGFSTSRMAIDGVRSWRSLSLIVWLFGVLGAIDRAAGGHCTHVRCIER